jgi:hypothetical protein
MGHVQGGASSWKFGLGGFATSESPFTKIVVSQILSGTDAKLCLGFTKLQEHLDKAQLIIGIRRYQINIRARKDDLSSVVRRTFGIISTVNDN